MTSPTDQSREPILDASIIIPVLNKLEFTAQCLDRIWRNTDPGLRYEVIVVDNASTDATPAFFSDLSRFPRPVRYLRQDVNIGFARGNNAGARAARGEYLLFLNNDTLVQPGWLTEMLAGVRGDATVGIVGLKQLFPYTNQVYHTGIVFNGDRQPEHLYPHLDGSLPQVNQQREYQAVNGACLLIGRALFEECGAFDEEYRNGYEDIDLCMKVRQRRRRVVCCTRAFIYHYAQISEGRTADDAANAQVFQRKWRDTVVPDRDLYLARDGPMRPANAVPARRLSPESIYLADRLDQGSALTWINAELALALSQRGVEVFVNGERPLSKTLSQELGGRLAPLLLSTPPVGGVQIKWSHYWPQHLNRELAGDHDLEFFVVNYLFGQSAAQPWDYWLQAVTGNGLDKLPLSEFCQSVLLQTGVPADRAHVWHPGYSPEIREAGVPANRPARFRFLTVTTSHDLERYNSLAILAAFCDAFGANDDATLVIKDYGASSGNTTLRQAIAARRRGDAIQYVTDFTSKRDLIALYRSCDAFVSAHRGEGFGMKILDAFACGLPVVMPLFGGPTAYGRPDNCYPVDFALVPMGDCLDSQSLHITNDPRWAEVDRRHLRDQLQAVYRDTGQRKTIGQRARETVEERFSWGSAADRLMEIVAAVRTRSGATRPPPSKAPARPAAEHSPYWLGLRMSVVIPTHNRKDKLLACLDALAGQTVLPQEFEVIVVDDGSTDGTGAALEGRAYPFDLRYIAQAASGPGVARNRAVQAAAGELVLFIGDDIVADPRLIEEHLLAHAESTEPGGAVLGHIDWPPSFTPNEVMEYVCGEAMLQFAYPLIRQLPALDHRFFYTSNISLRREFLTAAAEAGIAFDSAFRHAAFEDSELALRLTPRGLRIRYAPRALAWHDHWMDLDTFASREFRAGQMAVVFYRKHPGHDDQLQVKWLADIVAPAAALEQDAESLQRLEAFDAQSDVLLRSFAGSLAELLAISRKGAIPSLPALSPDRLRAALHNVLRIIFDVQRARGKVLEWYGNVGAAESVRAAQVLAAVLRKVEFFKLTPGDAALLPHLEDAEHSVVSGLTARLRSGAAVPPGGGVEPIRQRTARTVRRLVARPGLVRQLLRTDRFIQSRLQGHEDWLIRYQRLRSGVRKNLF